METLRDTQERLRSRITRGNAVGRERVYADAWLIRLRDALAQDFPALVQALGCEEFGEVVAEYLRRRPSRYRSIADVGCELPAFLREREFPGWAADLAALEWAMVEAFHADDSPPLDRARLGELGQSGEVAWASVRVTLDASVRIVRSRWRVADLLEEEVSEMPEPENGAWLIYRGGAGAEAQVMVWEHEPARLAILEALQAGSSLGEALAGAEGPEGVSYDAAQVSRWFGEWVESGVVRDVA